MLGHMWVKRAYKLELTEEQFCRLGGCSKEEFKSFIEEATLGHLCDISVTEGVTVTVVSRRRKRHDNALEKSRLRKAKSRRHAKGHTDVTLTEAEAEAEREEEEKNKTPPTEKKTSLPEGQNRPLAGMWDVAEKMLGSRPYVGKLVKTYSEEKVMIAIAKLASMRSPPDDPRGYVVEMLREPKELTDREKEKIETEKRKCQANPHGWPIWMLNT